MEHENIVIRWILSHDIIFHGQVDNLVNRSILLLDLSIIHHKSFNYPYLILFYSFIVTFSIIYLSIDFSVYLLN